MVQVVMCIIYRINNGKYEFLLLKRTPKKGNFWQPVGGKVEEFDKSLLDAAIREIEEETGITKNNISKIIENFYNFSYDKHYLTGEPIPKIDEFVFAFEISRDPKINLDKNPDKEHQKYAWSDYNKSLKKFKWNNNKMAFKKLKELLKF